jgi:iron(II)-dependent oxidoreductase
MASAPARSHAAADPGELAAGLADARERTLGLVAGLGDDDLERVHSALMSPLVWDLGHIAAFEDLWLVHRHGGQPMLRPEMGDVYDAFETPRAQRGDLPFLRRAEALDYLAEVRGRVLEPLAGGRGIDDPTMHELVIRHELQHAETMLQTLQLARIPGHEPAVDLPAPAAYPGATGLELVDVPGGPCEIGASAEGFAYDNERPRHVVELAAFRIGRTPVTNATWLTFAEGGGYERREWWSDEGWAWKEDQDITHPGGWTDDGREWRLGRCEPIALHTPVVHISWFEADAFARSIGARLPTEFEWEKAATWDQRILTGVGDVWEWTAGRFDGYPGFRFHPYREYSEVFFGGDHRVLRGGSRATSRRVATATFRNWDHPQRRQIFSGLRIARDAVT